VSPVSKYKTKMQKMPLKKRKKEKEKLHFRPLIE
jgi:hypothetical protein